MDLGLDQSQLIPLELKDADFDGILTWIETLLHIKLPHVETESPSKRSRSPNREVARRVYQLFQKDRQSLEEVLKDLQLKSPTKDSEIEVILEWLIIRLKSCMKSWQMKNARYLSTDGSSTLDSSRSQPDARVGLRQSVAEPSSPTLNNRRAFAASRERVAYPDLSSDLNGTEYDVKQPSHGDVKRSASKLFGIPTSEYSIAAPRNLDGTPLRPTSSRLANDVTSYSPPKSHVTAANVSFSTTGTRSANTSFWSEPGDPHQPTSSASTVASSVCLDGAEDEQREPPSTFGGSFPSLTDSQWAELEQQPSSSYEYGEPFSQVPDMGQVDDGGEIMTVASHLHSGHMTQTNDTKNPCLQSVGDNRSLENKHPVEQSPRGDDMNETSRSPAMRNYKCRKIVGDGLTHPALPSFGDGLPFNLKWESVRLMQMGKVTCRQLEDEWQEPRSLNSLYSLGGIPEHEQATGFDVDFEEFSFGAELAINPGSNDSILDVRLDRPIRHQQRNEFERAHGPNRILVIAFTQPKKSPIRANDLKQSILDMFTREQSNGELSFLGRDWVEFNTREKKNSDKKSRSNAHEFHLFAVRGPGLTEVSIRTFCDELLPSRENAHQLSGKLYSRFDIRASRTTEGGDFHIDQIEWLEDLKATDEDEGRFNDPVLPFDKTFNEADQEVIMTDGCGLVSAYGMRKICTAVGLPAGDRLPSAVQGRFAGAKGVWLLNEAEPHFSRVTDRPPEKLISVARSQVKINQKPSENVFTFYVLRFSGLPAPSTLFSPFLPILQNRIGPDADAKITGFVKSKIREMTESLYSALQDPQELRRWINEQNSIAKTTDRDMGIETTAGFPTYIVEKIIQMLESGFAPTENRFLAQEVQGAINVMLSLEKKNFKIPCPQSTFLMGVPDWTGTLRPGEVYVNFSQPFRDPSTGRLDWSWAGRDCIVARNPARRPSDIQKLKIVRIPEFETRGISDVIVFSVRGRQAEASKLQGGDYDGDIFWVCIEPVLVDPFRNAQAPRSLPEPHELFIEKDTTTFGELVGYNTAGDPPQSDRGLLRWLAINRQKRLEPSLLGKTTLLQERVAYKYGIDSPEATNLNDACDHIIDAPKQCYRFDNKALSRMCKKYGIPTDYKTCPEPAHRKYTSIDPDNPEDEVKLMSEINQRSIVDQVYFGVLEREIASARTMVKKALEDARIEDMQLRGYYDKRIASVTDTSGTGPALEQLKLGIDAVIRAGEQIPSHFKRAKKQGLRWIEHCRAIYDAIVPNDELMRHPVVREWVESSTPGALSTWDCLKASALSARCYHSKTGRIAFLVAGNELCIIKALASGKTRTLTHPAYFAVKPVKKRAFTEMQESERPASHDDGDQNMEDTFVTAIEDVQGEYQELCELDMTDENDFVDAREHTNRRR